MKKPLTVVVLMALMGLSNLYSQQRSISDYLAECERKYGRPADLVNGEKYFYPYGQANGDPFFYSDPRPARITIQGKAFEEAMLRYDVFNQKLVLDFMDIYGATSSLVLRNEWVESFAFEDLVFINMTGPGGERRFYQLVEEGTVSCVYKWSKKYQLNLTSGVQNYYFTEASKEAFLLVDGQFFPYRSNRSFLTVFDAENQKLVKQFIRQFKLKVKTASDSQIRQLIEYCNTLSNEDS